jgi:hypothetical protein
MKRKIQLRNDQISSYLRTDDAVQALKTSIDNGQTRLALQILAEIVDELIEVPEDKNSVVAEKVQEEPKQKSENKKETAPKEKQEQATETQV